MSENKTIRDGFIFYRSFFEGIKELPRDIQGEVLTAIMEYGLNGETTENLKPVAKAMFALIKPQIDANNKKYENGNKGGRPKKETEVKPNNNQSITKPKPKEKEKEKEKEKDIITPVGSKQKSFKSISEEEFKYSLIEFVDEFGKQTVRAFFEYWSEKDSKGKMRFQLQKTWDSKKRLTTWKNNESKFGNSIPVKSTPKTIPGPWN